MTDFGFETRDGYLRVRGELDMETAPLLLQALTPYDGHQVLLDLSGVEFVDSSGVSALLAARRTHANLKIINPTASVQRVFEVAGIAALLLDDDD